MSRAQLAAVQKALTQVEQERDRLERNHAEMHAAFTRATEELTAVRAERDAARRDALFFAERLEKQDHQYSHGHPQAVRYRLLRETLEAERDAALSRADKAEASAGAMREAIQRIIDTDTHGKNVIVNGVERPTGTDFCGRCNRNSFHIHASDCPIVLAKAALADDAGQAGRALAPSAREGAK